MVREGAVAEARAVGYMVQILRGVEHMHSRGVVHRDLKLDNFMLTAARHGPNAALELGCCACSGRARLAALRGSTLPRVESGPTARPYRFGCPSKLPPKSPIPPPLRAQGEGALKIIDFGLAWQFKPREAGGEGTLTARACARVGRVATAHA